MRPWPWQPSAAWRLRRGRDRNSTATPTVAPVHYSVFVEAKSEAPEIGEFRGFAHAIVLDEHKFRGDAEGSYLVVDPSKSEPIWVRFDEITAMRGPVDHRFPSGRVRSAGEGERARDRGGGGAGWKRAAAPAIAASQVQDVVGAEVRRRG